MMLNKLKQMSKHQNLFFQYSKQSFNSNKPVNFQQTYFNTITKRTFSSQSFQGSTSQIDSNIDIEALDDLEIRAQNIQKSIDDAKANIERKTLKGVQLAKNVTQRVEEDKFIKKQRFEIFISKMEQLQRSEKRLRRIEDSATAKMESAFVNSKTPLKDILYHYNKAAVRGFESSLVSKTLGQVNLALKARGNKPRVYDDYTAQEFDISWRMQTLASHIKVALQDELYFNHHFMAKTSRQLGDIGYKDTELIQKFFDKLHYMLDERTDQNLKNKKPHTFEQAVYGGFKNFIPRHYVFEGFQSSDEFMGYLKTLLEWEIQQKDGLKNLGVTPDETIHDLEISLAKLIQACQQVKEMQQDMIQTLDSLRQQYFKIQNIKDKHEFFENNKFIYYDMLELQDLLVRSGYISPEEAKEQFTSQPYEIRMERASRIFYEYVQVHAPELLSPQYEEFIQAAENSLQQRSDKQNLIRLDEQNDKISLSSLSESLIGLSKQALSYRKEVNGKDYLHKFYQEHCSQGEVQDASNPYYDISQHWESPNVRMERDYLKAWKVFEIEVNKMWPRLKHLIEQQLSQTDYNGQLHSLLALSLCKIEAQGLRENVFVNLQKQLQKEGLKKYARLQVDAIVDGLNGIALQSNQSDLARSVSRQLLNALSWKVSNQIDRFSFDQKLDLLWSICALKLEGQKGSLFKNLYTDLVQMNFQRTDNDLNYEQFKKVLDIQLYVTRVSPVKNEKWQQEHANEALRLLTLHPSMHQARFDESLANFDPFKKRVLEGVAKGLSMASIDHESSLASNIVGQSEHERSFSEDQYPYQPDLIFGYQGQKILLNVISATQTMKDIQKADGKVKFNQFILRELNKEKKNTRTVSVPITSVISYDIENLKLKMNDNYNFVDDMLQQIKQQQQISIKKGEENQITHIDFESLSEFSAHFSKEAPQYMDTLDSVLERNHLDAFFKQLYKIFQFKHQTEKQYKKVVYEQGIENLKFELMKILLLFQNVPQQQKEFISQFVPKQFKGDFKKMIEKEKDCLKSNKQRNETQRDQNKQDLDLKWVGTRLEVELPQLADQLNLKKNIAPEIINQRFMWVDDYFHYEDWAKEQKKAFDAFNLLIIPRKENDFKYFYDKQQHQRMVPKGIFPNPNKIRVILQPPQNNQTEQVGQSLKNKTNVLQHEIEKDPYQLMILNELAKQKSLKSIDIPNNLSFITNLQNIKQGLRQDYSDRQILDLILIKLQFTDKLIEEHLQHQKFSSGETKFIQRNPLSYRNFVKSTYFSKDQEDPFSHFYIKESGKIERVHVIEKEMKQKYKSIIQDTPDQETKDKIGDRILKTLSQKLEDMLLKNYRENEDFISLSHQLENEVKINYDIKSLMKSEFVYDIDPDLVDSSMNDEQFLILQRKRAETKLIKTKIMYKIHQDLDLTPSEKKYLGKWIFLIEYKQDINLLNVRDTMLQKNFSESDFKSSLSESDIALLNQIPQVHIDTAKHGQYALNDLILELSHFIDEEVINKVEIQIIGKKIKQEWDLPSNFQIIETRNKEIGIVINELEEVAWRSAGMIDKQEQDTLTSMFSIQRNKDSFDKQYYDIDMKSMKQFIGEINTYDKRIDYLEEWVSRKEEEIKSRVVLPSPSLRKPDNEIHAQVDAQYKKARESLVSKLLVNDDKDQMKQQKEYKDLNSQDLENIVESIAVRLNLFNRDYPAFLPQIVQAIMEHPHISNSSYYKMEAITKMFELDWRGDRTLKNKKEFLATHPLYVHPRGQSNLISYGVIGNNEVTQQLRQACIPFVESLSSQMIIKSQQSI